MNGESFGPYRLEALIGRGGMGEVHRAFDTTRKRIVALKRLPARVAADPAFQARFRAESEMAARLNSAHVIPIHDYGEIDGQLFIDMRLVEGQDLGQRLAQRGPMPPAEAVQVISQVAGALDTAHTAGLVHRDVKPSNVLLSPGEGADGLDFAYLVDFGIARAVDTATGLTGTDSIVGTVDYLAPERLEGRRCDHRIDIYSLACMLSETLSGSKPFPAGTVPAVLYAHINAPPPRPSLLRPGVPVALDAVVARGMAKDPHARFPTAGALAAAARAALAVSPNGRSRHRAPEADGEPTTVVLPRVPPSRPARWPIAVGAAVLALLLLVTGVVLLSPSGTTPVAQSGPRTLRVAENLAINAASGLAIAPSGDRFYVGAPAEQGTFAVEIRDTRTGARTAAVPVPGRTVGLALTADGTRLFAADWVSTTSSVPDSHLSVVDTAGGTVFSTVSLTGYPQAVAAAPDGTRAYVTVDSDLTVVDAEAGSVLTTVPLGARPKGVAVTPDGRTVVVSTSAGVKLVDATALTVTKTIGLRDEPSGVTITPDGDRAMVTTSAGGALFAVDLAAATVGVGVGVGTGPQHVAVSPDGSLALVANTGADTVSAVNLSDRTVSTLSVGRSPGAVAFSPDGTFGFVVTSSNVVRLDGMVTG